MSACILIIIAGSGKSTLFKQLETIHGNGFNEIKRRHYKSEIHEQMVDSMQLMIRTSNSWIQNTNDTHKKHNYTISNDLDEDVRLLNDTDMHSEITPQLKGALKRLWNDNAIKRCYQQRNIVCVPDSTEMFLDNIDQITSEDYIPSQNDIIMLSRPTHNKMEKIYHIKGHIFRIVDVGGQRSERSKWIHVFDNVSAVIFVTSLSCYNEAIYEDETANAMVESMDIFYEYCNSKYFSRTPFILFLNKSDIFEEKIKNIPITECTNFKDYSGDTQNFDECIAILIYINIYVAVNLRSNINICVII